MLGPVPRNEASGEEAHHRGGDGTEPAEAKSNGGRPEQRGGDEEQQRTDPERLQDCVRDDERHAPPLCVRTPPDTEGHATRNRIHDIEPDHNHDATIVTTRNLNRRHW